MTHDGHKIHIWPIAINANNAMNQSKIRSKNTEVGKRGKIMQLVPSAGKQVTTAKRHDWLWTWLVENTECFLWLAIASCTSFLNQSELNKRKTIVNTTTFNSQLKPLEDSIPTIHCVPRLLSLSPIKWSVVPWRNPASIWSIFSWGKKNSNLLLPSEVWQHVDHTKQKYQKQHDITMSYLENQKAETA